MATRVASFRHAGRGIFFLFFRETHGKIHGVATLIAIATGLWLDLSLLEWALVSLAIGLVVASEAINTAIESLADAVHPDQHPLVGRAKDLSAGGVLLASITALAVGLCVFGPYFWSLIQASP
ncbi:MAG: diacylglycerol kinase family protein [Planctomycetota bacterium]